MAGRGTDIKIDKEIDLLGGLHIISTEKFPSSRIDKQLFGRTARQGQNGTIQEIYSLDDYLLKKNLSPIIRNFLKRFNNYKFIKNISMFIYNIIQIKEDLKSSFRRKKILQRDFEIEGYLSFSSID